MEDHKYLQGFINQFEEDGEHQELRNEDWTVSQFLKWLKINNFVIVKDEEQLLEFKETKYKSIEDKNVEEIYQRENDNIQSEKESSFVIVPQEKTVSDLWRIAQKYNCDDFIQMINTLNIKIIYKDT